MKNKIPTEEFLLVNAEREAARKAYIYADGNLALTAKLLGCDRRTVYRKFSRKWLEAELKKHKETFSGFSEGVA